MSVPNGLATARPERGLCTLCCAGYPCAGIGIAYPGSTPRKIVSAWRHGAIEVVLSPFILDELPNSAAEQPKRVTVRRREGAIAGREPDDDVVSDEDGWASIPARSHAASDI